MRPPWLLLMLLLLLLLAALLLLPLLVLLLLVVVHLLGLLPLLQTWSLLGGCGVAIPASLQYGEVRARFGARVLLLVGMVERSILGLEAPAN